MTDNALSRFSQEAPSYLQTLKGEDTGIGELKNNVRPKYLAVVQGIGTLAKSFDPGSVVVKSAGKEPELFLPKGGVFYATPLYWWKDWAIWYHKNAKVANPVKERTLDPLHPIALRCKNKAMWGKTEPDPDNKDAAGNPLPLRWVESYYFALSVYDKPVENKNDIVVVSFRGGEYRTGSHFGESLATRVDGEGNSLPIYTGVYSFQVGVHDKKSSGDSWNGFNIKPAGFTPEAMIPEFKDSFEKFRELHGRAEIEGDDTGDDTVEGRPESADVSRF